MTEKEKNSYYETHKRTKLYKARDAARQRARYAAEKKYGKAFMKGKQVDHIDGAQGGVMSNDWSNIRIVDAHENMKRQPKRKGKPRSY